MVERRDGEDGDDGDRPSKLEHGALGQVMAKKGNGVSFVSMGERGEKDMEG